MFNNKIILRVICLITCFTLIFSLFSFSFADDGNISFKDVLTGDYDAIMSALTYVLVAMGDGILHMVILCVGESVTIDKLVYNDVQKVSIDYWDDISGDDVESATQEPIKAFMEPTVEKWYAVFFKIATMVYMIVLVYIGISILLSSTAEKKASYKELFMSWCMGIAILFMFPYVMKYIIVLNDALVNMLQAKSRASGFDESGREGILQTLSVLDAASLYGEDDFINALLGISEFENIQEEDLADMMALTRKAANGDENVDDDGDITLGIVYLIIIGQTIAVLIMYYKRAFMIAFLITIFPLVAMTYVIDKIRRWKKPIFWYMV